MRSKPPPDTGNEAKPDSSHSRTFLTRRNYNGPQLLTKIAGRESPSEKAVVQPSQKLMSKRERDVNTDDEPLSSSEAENTRTPENRSSHNEKSEYRSQHVQRTSKDSRKSAISRQPSKRRKVESPSSVDLSSQTSANRPASRNDVDIFGLPSSQAKVKRQKKYGNRKFTDIQDGLHEDEKSKSEFMHFPEPLNSALIVKTTQDFVSPDVILKGRPKRSKGQLLEKRAATCPYNLNVAPIEKPNAFSIPDLPDFPSSSSTTTLGKDTATIFDSPRLADTARQNRSGSISSMSSLDSLASLELQQDHKDGLAGGNVFGLPGSGTNLKCPICHQKLNRSDLPSLDPDLRSLPLRKQQVICNRHKTRDAYVSWQHHGYPNIDWDLLESSRIPKSISLLKRILSQQEDSYYTEQLRATIQSAKGNKKKIRTFLQEDIVDSIKPGYYGPRGAKIMVNNITQNLARELKRQLQKDSILQTVGVGSFVTAVLVPELTTRLVMEDMKVESQEKARTILSESTDIGMLLNPDDDHVIPNDED